MAGSVRDETWAWRGVSGSMKYLDVIPFIILWVVWKGMNMKAYEGVDNVDGFNTLKNRWF